MTERKPATKGTKRSAKGAAGASKGFTAEERAAMKDRARELKSGKADGEGALLAKIAEMAEPDRSMAERLHAASAKANLDDGAMWPTTFALKELTSAVEAKIAALVKKAVR